MKKSYNLKEHIVICNWNYKAERIIEELHSPLLKKAGMGRPVIVICEGDVRFPDTPAFEDTFCIPGDPVSSWKLRNANVQDAFAILILSNQAQGENADTHTIMVAMEIADLVDEMCAKNAIQTKPHVAAEISDSKKTKYLQRAGVNEIISGNDIGVRLLAQTAVTPGITSFMRDILQYSSDSNEIYIVPPPEELVDKKANFTQISEFLLKNRNYCHQAILVGVHIPHPSKMLVNPDNSEFPGLTSAHLLVVMARERPDWTKLPHLKD